ncbi:MAG: hypothetical protein WBC63_07580 [Candidatus Bipolaricaulia bacterium]
MPARRVLLACLVAACLANVIAVGGISAPAIGIAKSLESSTNNGDGSFTILYELIVRNYGNVPLDELQIDEDLAAAYPHPALCELLSVESDDFTASDLYDGVDEIGLLSGTDVLDVGETGTVRLALCLSPKSGVASYSNQALASGRSPSGIVTVDRSQSGENPDPDEDGDPGNNDEPTRLSFAQFELGGTLQMTVSWSDTVGFELNGISLSAFLSVEGFTAQVGTSFANTGMDTFSVSANGTLGEVRLNSSLTFDPSTVSFVSWQGGTAFSLLDLDVTNIVHVGVPQTASYTQFAVSGAAGGLSAQGTVKLGISPLVFSATNVCGTWDWTGCDTAITVCALLTGTDGFSSATVSMTDYVLFEDIFGIRGSLDVAISFTLEEKTLTPTLKLQPDWFICPDIQLLSEISAGPGLASVEALLVYGIQGECEIGDHVTIRFAESLADEKNSAVTGKAEYFELIGVSGSLRSCCGSAGAFDVAAYFESAPAPSSALFGMGLITASFDVQIVSNFAFSFEAEFPTTGSGWSFASTFSVIW